MPDNEIKKAVIRKSVNRKINTGNYSNVDIMVDISKEIEYSSPKDLNEKSKNLTKFLLIDLDQTVKDVMNELKLEQKKATVNGNPDLSEIDLMENDFDSI